MKKVLSIMLFVFISFVYANGQSSNARSQGNYYSAKELYQSSNYNGALDYIYKAKKLINGSNIQLQYLHVMAAYRAKKYSEAKAELETFFKIQDGEIKSIHFDKSVDPLTNDEVKEITKIINPVEEALESSVASETAAKKRNVKYEQIEKLLTQLNALIEESSGIGITYSYELNKMNKIKSKSYEFYYNSPFTYSSSDNSYLLKFKSVDRVVHAKTETNVRNYSEYFTVFSDFNFKDFKTFKLRDYGYDENVNKITTLTLEFSSSLYYSINGNKKEAQDYLWLRIDKNKEHRVNEIISVIEQLKKLESN